MYTIRQNSYNEITIQKSRFICELIFLSDPNHITQELQKIKEKWPNANHYCYAYCYKTIRHCSDDGEPSGTAGIPILNVLETRQLDHILCIVIRYFGGIKLGVGGLLRAYTKSVTEALNHADIGRFIYGKTCIISFPYHQFKQVDYQLKQEQIIKKEFDEKIYYTIQFSNESYQKLSPFFALHQITIEREEDSYFILK